MGIPKIACTCPTCTSTDPKDKRTRSSIVVDVDGQKILIDTTPELRLQCLASNITDIDACLITHTHADHIMGMDDIRGFTKAHSKQIEVWSSNKHFDSLYNIFGYADIKNTIGNPSLPQVIFKLFDTETPFSAAGVTIQPIELPHVDFVEIAKMTSIGFRIGPFAYCTDTCEMTPEIIEKIKGVDTLILGVLRAKPHAAHLNIERAIEIGKEVGARQTFFTHLGHSILHAREQADLPNGFYLAHDNMKIEVKE